MLHLVVDLNVYILNSMCFLLSLNLVYSVLQCTSSLLYAPSIGFLFIRYHKRQRRGQWGCPLPLFGQKFPDLIPNGRKLEIFITSQCRWHQGAQIQTVFGLNVENLLAAPGWSLAGRSLYCRRWCCRAVHQTYWRHLLLSTFKTDSFPHNWWTSPRWLHDIPYLSIKLRRYPWCMEFTSNEDDHFFPCFGVLQKCQV